MSTVGLYPTKPRLESIGCPVVLLRLSAFLVSPVVFHRDKLLMFFIPSV